ncbi:tetratricopeptide repeat protein [Tellurirhabdus rosea]|uniref:tetratricopeptide repeat protein n=1 Tax=Tellurirhabdus rosea TaxID=2674997 RepID=UPI002250A46C|nr:tetratricopeptide repeat protein [Tellurirhabdus rosea]
MTYLILSFLLWLSDNRSVAQVSQKNTARLEAFKAYQAGNYQRAADQYSLLLRSSLFVEPTARLNLGHSYFQLRRYPDAQRYYQQVAQVRQPELAAQAMLQLGVIACLKGDTLTALRQYRQALQMQPDLPEAQFNYEFISKRFSGRVPRSKAPKKEIQKQAAASNEADVQPGQPNAGREVEQNDRRTDLLRRLRSLNLTEAQVLQLLNSMEDTEVQYIQQRKPSSLASKEARKAYRTW